MIDAVYFIILKPKPVRLVSLAFLIIIFQEGRSQNPSEIAGRWRVVVMDNGVKFNYKTETYTVSQKLKDTLNNRKENFFDLDDYINWAASCSNCNFVFLEDGTYQKFRETELRSEGSFSLVSKDSSMNLTIKSGDRNTSKVYQYYMEGERLVLRMPSFFLKEHERITVELEKID